MIAPCFCGDMDLLIHLRMTALEEMNKAKELLLDKTKTEQKIAAQVYLLYVVCYISFQLAINLSHL